jgi:iron(III) transport system ATP-binding protein
MRATRERLTVEVRDILKAGRSDRDAGHAQRSTKRSAMADHIGTMHNGRLTRWTDSVPT